MPVEAGCLNCIKAFCCQVKVMKVIDTMKWTILYINHKSEYYFKYQLKLLYETNNPKDFELLIVDNSKSPEVDSLVSCTKKYSDKFSNVKILHFIPKGKFNEDGERDEHGESVDFAMEHINSKYLLVQDPDFFWVKKKYLKFLESFFDDGCVAIGAPYADKAANGPVDFPAAFGCAYLVDKVRGVSFKGEYLDKDFIHSLREKYPVEDGFGYPCDMGYQIRLELADEKYSSFFPARNFAAKLVKYFGQHHNVVSVAYFHEGEEVAFHLFGGSREPHQVLEFMNRSKNEQKKIFKQWKKIRIKNSRFLYIRSHSKAGSVLFGMYVIISSKIRHWFTG